MRIAIIFFCSFLATSTFGQMNESEVKKYYNEGVQHFTDGDQLHYDSYDLGTSYDEFDNYDEFLS